MKTLLTKFAKKPVAVLLAVLMVVGSISVAVYAENEPTVNVTIGAVWNVYDSDESVYKPATYANPGDSVRADIYITSDTPLKNITLIFSFAKDLLENDWTKYEPNNNVYKAISPSGLSGFVADAATTYDSIAADNGPDQGLRESCTVPEGYFDDYGGTLANVSANTYVAYESATNILTFYYTVKSKDTVEPDSAAEITVLPKTYCSLEICYPGGIDSPEYGYTSTTGVSIYDPVWNEPTTSEYFYLRISDSAANQQLLFGGDINFNSVSDTYGTIGTGTEATINDYYGEALKGADIPAVTPASSAYQVIGWSTSLATGDQTDANGDPVYGGSYADMVVDLSDLQETYSTITYKDSDNADTLYAVYGTADVDYEVRVFTQVLDANGQPTDDYEPYNVPAPTQEDPDNKTNVHTATGKYGATVNMDNVDDSWIPSEGFTLNADNSKTSQQLTGSSDSDYLQLFYDRNKFTITWKIDGTEIDSADIYYGADAGVANYPDPGSTMYTNPDDDNFGYKIDGDAWSDHEFECTDNIVVEGALAPLDVNVIYHNTDASGNAGTFASGNSTFTAAKKYGDSIGSADFTDTLTPPTGYHFADNAASYTGADGDTVDVTDLGALPDITKDNYNCTNFADNVICIDVYPNFEIDHGEITFDANGGSFNGEDKYTEEYDYGANIYNPENDLTAKSETDDSGVVSYYDFVGWGEASDATKEDKVDPDATYTTDKTYYAIWEDNRVTITFVGPEGTVLTEKRNLTDGKYIVTGDDFPAADAVPEQDGEHWIWNEDPGIEITADFSIPGHYEYDLVYSITDKNGNTTTTDPVQLKEGDNLPGQAVDEVTGATFKGWYSDASCETLYVEAGSETTMQMPAAPLTLYGKYELDKHTVTYYVDGEQDGEPETYEYGKPLTIRAEPTKEGYTFSGWDPAALPDTMGTEDIEVNGTFTANDYTIVYMNGDKIVKVITQAYESTIDPSLEPDGNELTNAEQKFDSWSDTLPATMPIYTDTVTGTENGEEKTYENAKKIEAQFVPQEYTLTYKVDGEVDGEVETYKVGDPITMRAEPTKEGYSFSGWSDTLTEMPASDITIEGTFTPNIYNIVYTVDGEVVKVITQAYGTDITETEPDAPAATPEKTFTGWSQSLPTTMPVCTDTVAGYENALEIKALFSDNEQVTVTYVHADGSEDELKGYPGADLTPAAFKDSDYTDGYDIAWDQDLTTFPGADTTVNLKKTAKTVSVKLDPANGDDPTTTDVPYNGTVTKPEDPTSPDGADFEGWVLPDGTPFDFSKRIEDQVDYGTGELEIKARFSVTDNYYIATGANGDDFTYELMQGYKHYTDAAEETYTVPEIPEMEGFTAKFWSLDKETDAAPDGTWSTSSRDFYAVYDINKYTITYIVDGTEYQKFEDVPFASEVKRPDADPEKEGYVFGGWKDEDGKAPGNYESMPAKNLTFTADWVVPGADYTLTYYDREGKVYRVFTVHSGDPITADYIPEDPTRFAYVFKGWDPEIPDVMPEENLELNAVWELDPKFVAMVVGGVVVSGAVVGTVAAGNAALITGAAIVGGVALVVGGTILAEHTHKVTYIVDGETYRVYYLVEGTKVIVPKAPTKDGADFTGWTPEVPDRMPANDLVFNATWSTDAANSNNGPAPVDNDIPDTGSAAAGLSAFAVIATAAAAAYIIKRKKEDEE